MPDERRPAISDAEREVLKVLWDQGPLGVRAVQGELAKQGQEWSRSTVITLLQRLEKKGYVASDKSGFAFVFRAAVSREEIVHQRMAELADELCAGEAAPLVLAFAERHRFTADELAKFRRMIERVEVKRPRRKSGK
jgi:predicted transcriptional regulator